MSVASYFMYHYAPWRKDMSGEIKPHCMGTEFPKRDTDSPNVEWVSAVTDRFLEALAINLDREIVADAVAEEQRVKEKTGAQVPNR